MGKRLIIKNANFSGGCIAVEPPVISISDDGNVHIYSDLGFDIYYTIDGSTPTTNSDKYISDIVLSDDAVVKAICVNDEGVKSSVAEKKYIKGNWAFDLLGESLNATWLGNQVFIFTEESSSLIAGKEIVKILVRNIITNTEEETFNPHYVEIGYCDYDATITSPVPIYKGDTISGEYITLSPHVVVPSGKRLYFRQTDGSAGNNVAAQSKIMNIEGYGNSFGSSIIKLNFGCCIDFYCITPK